MAFLEGMVPQVWMELMVLEDFLDLLDPKETSVRMGHVVTSDCLVLMGIQLLVVGPSLHVGPQRNTSSSSDSRV